MLRRGQGQDRARQGSHSPPSMIGASLAGSVAQSVNSNRLAATRSSTVWPGSGWAEPIVNVTPWGPVEEGLVRVG